VCPTLQFDQVLMTDVVSLVTYSLPFGLNCETVTVSPMVPCTWLK
jgi:hypothetical protein